MQMQNRNNTQTRMQIHLPSDITAEERVIGTMIFAPQLIGDIAAIVNESHFNDYRLQMLYSVIAEMHAANKPIDSGLVARELRERGQLGDFDNGAYILHLEGTIQLGITTQTILGYAEVVKRLGDRRSLLLALSESGANAYNRDPADVVNDIISSMMAIRHQIAPPEKSDEEAISTIPELPENVKLPVYDPSSGVGAFLTAYCHYSSSRSPMTPMIFHEASALWLGSVVIARRLKLEMDFDTIYPNLYIIWLAPSTLWHKTTAMKLVRGVAWKSAGHLLAAQDTTLEALISDMAGSEPQNMSLQSEDSLTLWREGKNFAAQKALMLDEMSGMMASSGKDYNSGLIEAFLRFYDCDDMPFVRSTKGQGWQVIKAPYMSFLGASTPSAMHKHMVDETLWTNGWWPRFAILAPEEKRPVFQESAQSRNQDLIDVLSALYNRLPKPMFPDPPESRCVIIHQSALQAWKRYYKAVSYDLVRDELDSRLHPVYGRLPIQALKIAIIIAALDWATERFTERRPRIAHANRSPVFAEWVNNVYDYPLTPTITIQHMARALQIAESWRASAHRALIAVTTSAEGKFLEQLLAYVGRYGEGGASLRDLYRGLHKKPKEVEDGLKQLMSTGEVVSINPPAGSRGRPTVRYKAV